MLDEPRILSSGPAFTPETPEAGSPRANEADNAERHACYVGYRPSGRAALDLLRLGALCGPSNGLAKEPELSLGVRPLPAASDGEEDLLPTVSTLVHGVKVSAGECVWAAFATDAVRSEAAPRVELQWLDAGEVVARCEADGAGMCPTTGPWCAARSGTYELVLEEAGVRIQLWRRGIASGR